MAKNVDLKQFLLQKGERLGLWVALVIMLLLVVWGGWNGFSSASPSDTAHDIKTKAETINNKIHTTPAESDPEIPAALTGKLSNDPVSLLSYVTPTPNFIETGLEDTKRLAPTVLGPFEFDGQAVRVQVINYMFNDVGDNRRVGVLIPKDKDTAKKDGADIQKFLSQRGYRVPAGQPIDPRITAWFNSYQQQAKLMDQMMKHYQQAAAGGPEFAPKQDVSLEFVDARKIPQGAKMATTVQPYRMVMVSATFPYKAQLDEFRRALKVRSVNELYNSKEDLMPRFTRIVVQRRALDVRGKVVENWTPLDLEKDILPVLAHAVSFSPLEPNEDSLRAVTFDGLVMARPKLARGDYPRSNLPELAKKLQEFQTRMAANTAVMVAAPKERELGSTQGIHAFGLGTSAEDNGKGPGPKEGPKGTTDDKEKEIIYPEYCLVRFCDVNVQPGLTYEYQMKLRVANPNFGKPESQLSYPDLAKTKEIESLEWAPKEPEKCRVSLASENFYYATELDDKTLDEKSRRDSRLKGDKDVTFVQMHRWLERVRLNPENAASLFPVGDWTVADVAVRRGEYMGRMEQVKLPVWFPTRECFDFAVPIVTAPTGPMVIGRKPTPGPKGIPVSFATEPPPGDLLVDWEGGKVVQNFKITEKTSKDVKEDAAVEILVMAPDGTLRVRNSRTDLNNPERKQRFEEWKKLLDDTENKGKKEPGKDDPFKKPK